MVRHKTCMLITLFVAFLGASAQGRAIEPPTIEVDLSTSQPVDAATLTTIRQAKDLAQLSPFFTSDDLSATRAAIQRCRELKLQASAPMLAKLLSDSQKQPVWTEAIKALAALNAVEFLSRIEAVALTDSSQVRFHSLQALTKMGSENVLRFLVQGVHDSDKRVQHFALERIGEYWKEELTYHLLNQYLKEEDREVRTQILNIVSTAWQKKTTHSIDKQQRMAENLFDSAPSSKTVQSRIKAAKIHLFEKNK